MPHSPGCCRGSHRNCDRGRVELESKNGAAVERAFRRGRPFQYLGDRSRPRAQADLLLQEQVKSVIDATLQSKPDGATHWSCRLMATTSGIKA